MDRKEVEQRDPRKIPRDFGSRAWQSRARAFGIQAPTPAFRLDNMPVPARQTESVPVPQPAQAAAMGEVVSLEVSVQELEEQPLAEVA
jgi:hypothetical protein